ncbi:PspC domain-containing protein [Paenibacillus sp. MBLB4367]|uniref:PspC domain-containing protein n=1 Tax=Paenibacillus sp. MBLB4367 TaxID=3384767 RepID=UPI003907F3E0
MNKLYRSNNNVKIAGVCGGIGERYNVDPTLVRLGTVAAVLFSGGGFLFLYLAAAVLVPKAPVSSAGFTQHDAAFASDAYRYDRQPDVKAAKDVWMTEEEQLAVRAKINHMRAKLAKYENAGARTE